LLNFLGLFFFYGIGGIKKNFKNSLKHFEYLKKENNLTILSEMYYYIGLIYDIGDEEVKSNIMEAIKYYSKSLEINKNKLAILNLKNLIESDEIKDVDLKNYLIKNVC
jgi:TPR repeat protein